MTAHVVVAGGGACGMVAALAAREAGAEVLVVEQDATPAGSTAMSQGLICAAGTRAQREAGVADDAGIFFEDIVRKTRGQTDERLARTIARDAGPCLNWLANVHGLPFTLDQRFRAAYGHSRLRVHGWPGHGGGDLIGFLGTRAAALGIDVVTRARLAEVVADGDGTVREVVIARPDGPPERLPCRTLVLATSGFAANPEMVARHMPEMAAIHHHGHEGNRGAGIQIGARLGGALADMGSYQGYAMLAVQLGVSLPPGHIVEGGVLVNCHGERFCDEAEDIAGMVHPVQAQPGGEVWAIYDAAIEDACAHIPETQTIVEMRAARVAPSVSELASITGLPEAALDRALADIWLARREGRPDSVGRRWGDVSPPSAPFRALKVRGALYHTQGGLQIDGSARVLRADGSALPNLFAGGGAARGVSGPSFWGYLPAMGLCAAVTLGRIAGTSAAALALGMQDA